MVQQGRIIRDATPFWEMILLTWSQDQLVLNVYLPLYSIVIIWDDAMVSEVMLLLLLVQSLTNQPVDGDARVLQGRIG